MGSTTLLVVGASGEVGFQVLLEAHKRNRYARIVGTYCSNKPTLPESLAASASNNIELVQLDLAEDESIAKVVSDIKPDVLVHCAVSPQSFNSSGKEGRTIRDATVLSAVNLMKAGRSVGTKKMVFLSTDLVFDGKLGRPLNEKDEVKPIMEYGQAKVDMENALLEGDAQDVLVVRTSIVLTLDPPGKLAKWFVQAANNATPTTLFTDEFRNVVFGDELAHAMLYVADLPNVHGVLHIAGPKSTTRYEIAHMFSEKLGIPVDQRIARLLPGLAANSGLIRPSDCSFDCSLLESLLQGNNENIVFHSVDQRLKDWNLSLLS